MNERDLKPTRRHSSRPKPALNDRELATVLAALRLFQEQDADDRADSEYFADVKPLTDDQIDALCERLNLAD